MRSFARLYRALDASSRSGPKLAALASYFSQAPQADAAWALWLLCGERLAQPVPTRVLKAAAMHACDLDAALFADCYESVGDLAETIALLLPEGGRDDDAPLHVWISQRITPLRGRSPEQQMQALARLWRCVDRGDAFVLNKLLTGGLRVGVSRGLALRGLATSTGLAVETLAARMAGQWLPDVDHWRRLVAVEADAPDDAQPYPFRLAHPLEGPATSLGEVRDWIAEWKWDGIRGQLLRREATHLWSRGNENLDAAFPDLLECARHLPAGTVLDGEVLVRRIDVGETLEPGKAPAVAPFAALQRRLGRKAPGRALLASHPAVFLAFDLLELAGQDLRKQPLAERRACLENLLAGAAGNAHIVLSPTLACGDWAQLATMRDSARTLAAEGLMLKHRASAYGSGRARGDWWKWKLDPYSVDAVMVYAQAGHGRRAGLFTDYTFAVWHEGALVPFAKAYSGLSDAEIREVDRYVRRHTLDIFGPVRQVHPELVFEIGFEGIQSSRRHKAGVAVRFPRILRWRHDKTSSQADSLDTLKRLAEPPQATPPGVADRDQNASSGPR